MVDRDDGAARRHPPLSARPGRARPQGRVSQGAGRVAEGRLHPGPHRRRFYEIEDAPALEKNFKHDIEVVVDRLVVRAGIETRLADSLETGAEARRRPRLSRPGRCARRPRCGEGRRRVTSSDAATPSRPHRRRRRARGGGRAQGPRRQRPRRPHHLLREIRLPGLRLHHRRDRAAPVLLQRAAGRLPGLRRARREAALRSRPDRPQRGALDQEGRGRPLGALQPAQPLLHAGARQPRRASSASSSRRRGRSCPRRSTTSSSTAPRAARSPCASSTAASPTR